MEKLIISLSYGYEHPAYVRCRNLWSVYREYFRDQADITFLRATLDLKPGEMSYHDGEYVFGRRSSGKNDNLGYAAIHDAGGYLVNRLLDMVSYLLRSEQKPFWLYCGSITSAIDVRLLRGLLNTVNCHNYFGGYPLYARIPSNFVDDLPEGRIFRMISGSGMLFSSDVLELLLARQNIISQENLLGDVWISLLLRDIPRTPMLRSDILEYTNFNTENRSCLIERVARDLTAGYFSFRVKSGRWEVGSHKSEDIDTLVVNDILLYLLSCPPRIDVAVNGWAEYRKSICDLDDRHLAPVG